MATRSNIIVTDGNELCKVFYKHWDGGENHDLLKDLLQSTQQHAFETIFDLVSDMDGVEYDDDDQQLHVDIEYLNVIDVAKRTLTTYSVDLYDESDNNKKEIKHFNF